MGAGGDNGVTEAQPLPPLRSLDLHLMVGHEARVALDDGDPALPREPGQPVGELFHDARFPGAQRLEVDVALAETHAVVHQRLRRADHAGHVQ